MLSEAIPELSLTHEEKVQYNALVAELSGADTDMKKYLLYSKIYKLVRTEPILAVRLRTKLKRYHKKLFPNRSTPSLNTNSDIANHPDKCGVNEVIKIADEGDEDQLDNIDSRITIDTIDLTERLIKTDQSVSLMPHNRPIGSSLGEKDIQSFVRVSSTCQARKLFYDRLYPHQVDGLVFLSQLDALYGGILGDEMGCGKTIQIIVYLDYLFAYRRVKTVLIVVPPTLIDNWVEEFGKWSIDVPVVKFYESKLKDETVAGLRGVLLTNGVVITSYSYCLTRADSITNNQTHKYDYLICDEVHLLKNPAAKITKGMKELRARVRVGLSGTPVQNNLNELWGIYDFLVPGLLWTKQGFEREFKKKIDASRNRNALPFEKKTGDLAFKKLIHHIHPYFLARTKADTLAKSAHTMASAASPAIINSNYNSSNNYTDDGIEEIVHSGGNPKKGLPTKHEFAIWLPLTELQKTLYLEKTHSYEFEEAILKNVHPFVAIAMLKGILLHPILSESSAKSKLATLPTSNTANNGIKLTPVESIVQMSHKMAYVQRLLQSIFPTGDKVLFFSTSKKILDLVEIILTSEGYCFYRIDGDTPPETRQFLVSRFNTLSNNTDSPANSSNSKFTPFVFLLTTKVGGVGLNITGANHVILYDNQWNPSIDSQAIGRAFRIGQMKKVFVYRLITNGTIEEKIYQLTIHKEITNQITMTKAIDKMRFFSDTDLSFLFKLGSFDVSDTCESISHIYQREKLAVAPDIVQFMENITFDPHYVQISLHSELFGLKEDIINSVFKNSDSNTSPEGAGFGDAHYMHTSDTRLSGVSPFAKSPKPNNLLTNFKKNSNYKPPGVGSSGRRHIGIDDRVVITEGPITQTNSTDTTLLSETSKIRIQHVPTSTFYNHIDLPAHNSEKLHIESVNKMKELIKNRNKKIKFT